MTTQKLRIKRTTNDVLIQQYSEQYVGLSLKLYNNFELCKDDGFKQELLERFPLFDVSMLDWAIDDVKAKFKTLETQIEGKKDEIAQIEKIIAGQMVETIWDKRYKFKLVRKLETLRKNLYKKTCFGGKALLRRITEQSQKPRSGKYTEEEIIKAHDLYDKYLAEFREKRKYGVYLIGRANEGGNRKVDFDLTHDTIIFKPNKDNHVEIEFCSSKKQHKILWQLQQMADANLLSITVRIDNKFVYLSYDEELLNGFSFDMNGYNRAKQKGNIQSEEARKELYKIFKREQETRQLKGKVINRLAAVDLNPYEISLVIGAETGNDSEGSFRVIYKRVWKLDGLSKKIGKASDSDEQDYQNNKRKHEIKEIINEIFAIVTHYKCAKFVMENLLFKGNKKDKGREFNRMVKNVWHRELTTKLIIKHCNIRGIIIAPVSTVYSSFIGNMLYDDYDPIAAAMEILRRGIIKYKLGSSLYPSISGSTKEKLTAKLCYLFGKTIYFDVATEKWVSLYKRIFKAGLRYRNKNLVSYSVQFMASPKSGVQVFRPAA